MPAVAVRTQGRREVYTPEQSRAIVQALKQGNTRQVAATLAGIGKTTFYEWMDKDADFADAVLRAEAERESKVVCRILDSEDDRLSLEWLKRRHRDDWGDQIKTESTSVSVSIVVPEPGVVLSRLKELLAQARAAASIPAGQTLDGVLVDAATQGVSELTQEP